ncbi:MAG: RIP metalloprotease RseP [Lachnospiraceae bacterium]|nr:RIP metalloprotease RseP [Lachnospiraceae bacterium]
MGDKIKKFLSKPLNQLIVVAVILAVLLVCVGNFRSMFIKILVALIVFSLIIIIHEFGHFILAKKNGIGVTDFSLGMGPKIWSVQKGETTYSLRWLPLGGSCMMVGEDQDIELDNAFNKKSVWARMSVVVAGPVFNFILAFILSLVLVGIVGWDYAKVTNVIDNMPAKEAGLKKGDIILEVNGREIINARDLQSQLNMFYPIDSTDPVTMVVSRKGEKKTFTVNPKKVVEYVITGAELEGNTELTIIKSVEEDSPLDKAGLKAGDRIVGINGTVTETYEEFEDYIINNDLEKNIEIEYVRENDTKHNVQVNLTEKNESYMVGFVYSQQRTEGLSAVQTIKYSACEVKYWIKVAVQSLGYMIKGKASRKDVSGPLGMVNFIGDAYEESYNEDGLGYATLNMMYICILLSANIGVMNLLPIPALDGGRLLFLIIEAIRRKPIKREVEGMIHAIGLILLMILMVFVFFNDAINIAGK